MVLRERRKGQEEKGGGVEWKGKRGWCHDGERRDRWFVYVQILNDPDSKLIFKVLTITSGKFVVFWSSKPSRQSITPKLLVPYGDQQVERRRLRGIFKCLTD